jgi:FkbM family methyltransferase
MNFSGVSDKSLVGKALRFPLRFVPPDTVLPILQGKLKGLKWITGSSNHGCWLGSYEYDKRVVFESCVTEGSAVFDIGANVGFYTLLASVLVGDRGKVVAFEPFPRNLAYLKSHLRMNRIRNVSVVEAGVWDCTGELMFEEGRDNFTEHISDVGSLRIRAVMIDGLVSGGEVPPPTQMKVDVEGAEFRVLLGSRSVLAAYHPTIFLATHGRDLHRECCRLLYSLGYHLEPISGPALDQTDEILAYAKD